MNRSAWTLPAIAAANVMAVALVVRGFWAIPLLAAAAAPVALKVLARPQRGLLLMAALLPFDGLRVPLGLPDASKQWITVTLAFVAVASLFTSAPNRRQAKGRWPPWAWALIGLVALSVISAVQVDPAQAQAGLKVSFQAAVFALIAWRCPLDDKERDTLVTIFVAVGAITAAFGLVQQAMGAERLHSLGYEFNATIRTSNGVLRSFSTFLQPFPFGFYLMVVVLLCLPIALDDPARLRNKIFLFLLPLYGLGLLSAIVRGAWLGAAFGLLYLGIKRHRLILLGIPVALVVLLFIPTEQSTAAFSTRSGTERTTSWSQNFGQVLDSPFGIGVGATGAAANKVNVEAGLGAGYQSLGLVDGGAYAPDNQFFKFSLELGILGVFAYIMFLAGAFSTSVQAATRATGIDRSMALGIGAVVLGYAAGGLVATILEIAPVNNLFWLLLGVVSAVWSSREQALDEGASSDYASVPV